MFRGVVARAVRVSARRPLMAVAAPSLVNQVIRLNSTQPPPPTTKTPEQLAKKAALEKQDDLRRDWDAVVLSYEDLVPKTESPSPSTYLIDVREPDEVIQGMIPSAVNLPLSVLSNALNMAPIAFKQKFGFEKPSRAQEITFYCRSGMRSTTACDVAKRNGYTKLLNYKGSWLEWTEKQNAKSNISGSEPPSQPLP